MISSSYDAWVTREPPWYDYEPPVYRCSQCGRFLSQEPAYARSWCHFYWCDGEPSVVEETHDEAVLAIIGDEFRDKTYITAWAPACGSQDGAQENWHRNDGEINPDEADAWKHAPHSFADPYEVGEVSVRICTCGCINEEVSF